MLKVENIFKFKEFSGHLFTKLKLFLNALQSEVDFHELGNHLQKLQLFILVKVEFLEPVKQVLPEPMSKNIALLITFSNLGFNLGSEFLDNLVPCHIILWSTNRILLNFCDCWAI